MTAVVSGISASDEFARIVAGLADNPRHVSCVAVFRIVDPPISAVAVIRAEAGFEIAKFVFVASGIRDAVSGFDVTGVVSAADSVVAKRDLRIARRLGDAAFELAICAAPVAVRVGPVQPAPLDPPDLVRPSPNPGILIKSNLPDVPSGIRYQGFGMYRMVAETNKHRKSNRTDNSTLSQ